MLRKSSICLCRRKLLRDSWTWSVLCLEDVLPSSRLLTHLFCRLSFSVFIAYLLSPRGKKMHLGEKKKEKPNSEGYKWSHCRGAGLCKRHEQTGPVKLSRMQPGRPSLPTHAWHTHWHSRGLSIHAKGPQSPGQRLAVYTPDMENVWGGKKINWQKVN